MYELHFNEEQQRLELLNTADAKQKPFYLDFTTGKMAYRLNQGIGRQQPLARAVGIKKDHMPTVLDATAGLGRDAFLLACCGCQITLLERSPLLYALLNDALQRAQPVLSDIIERMQLHQADAQEYLQQSVSYDVIYLDPMYPERSKTALVKQEMRIVRDVVGDDADIIATFERSLQTATQRVVVKRHRLALPLAEREPQYQIIGKTTRFDVYLIR